MLLITDFNGLDIDFACKSQCLKVHIFLAHFHLLHFTAENTQIGRLHARHIERIAFAQSAGRTMIMASALSCVGLPLRIDSTALRLRL